MQIACEAGSQRPHIFIFTFLDQRRYKKYQGAPVQLQVLEMMTVKSRLMCGRECAGRTDCSAFRLVEDQGTANCELLKEGTGILMQNFFIFVN